MKFAVTALALGLAGFSVAAHAQQITGAGSTFAAPIYAKWGDASSATAKVTLNYQAIGSGAGINQINNRTVDFGASDMPVKADQLAAHKLMQFPTVVGGIDIIVNLPGVKANELKLTGPILADIYLGKITHWNDKAITAINPGLKLPHLAIASVHRADGSGTTFVFTDYLSTQSPEWKSKVGSSTSVSWPVGAGAKGSDGVAGTVRQIPGGIGYDESAYAAQNHLTTVLLQNKDGKFVAPTMESFEAAAANADWSKVQNFAIDLNDQPGAASWPIESATFVLLPTDPKDVNQSAAVKKFFDWGFSHGSDIARGLLYIPLPASVQNAIRAEWQKDVPGTM
ncbi:MAG TPA: phosphate ABC transporter substrate-binding protein PstS [Rhodopila sp.]|jgi:phosphate transport system substrate-binding protein|nr:phosphate ABC transporter substrate-binding protein PstS [Rhodopila sp.]